MPLVELPPPRAGGDALSRNDATSGRCAILQTVAVNIRVMANRDPWGAARLHW